MNIHERSDVTNRWHNFIDLVPEFSSDNTILDYGGNRGNLLYNSNGVIKEDNYTSVDITLDCVEEGKTEFPRADFVHYDCYNYMYNHNGTYDLPFPAMSRKDYIFAYSVFSHTDFNTMLKTIQWFKTLDPKRIVFSYLNIDNPKIENYFYEKRIEQYGSCIEFRNNKSNFFYLVDNYKVIEDQVKLKKEDCNHFIALYNTNWLINKFAEYDIKSKCIKDTGINFLEILDD